jgi:hypothetical protein
MSDFLMRLVARELGQAPVVEPAPRALYEPDAGRTDAPPSEPAIDLQARGARRAPSSAARSPIDGTSALSGAAPRLPSVTREPPAMPRALSPPLPLIVHARTEHVHAEPEPLRTDTLERTQTIEHHSETRTERVRIIAHEPLATIVPIPTAQDSPVRARGRDRSHDLPVGPSHGGVERSSSRQLRYAPPRDRFAAPTLVHERTGAAGEERVRVHAAARSPESARPSFQALPAVEAPIHVSIGRIEVTALTNTARPVNKTKARQRVPLDEYLAARRRGAR